MPSLSFDIFGSQIDGARDYQEDAFLITHLGDAENDSSGSLVIVADGMGGHAAGNVASNMAVQTFNRHISKSFPNEDISNVLYEAVLQANGSITATVAETAALKGMGCTLVACVLEQGKLRWVSVGDSHLYILRDGTLTKKNADHSYGGFLDRMAEAGTPVEAEAGFSRNMLMSALTGDDIAEIDCPPSALEIGAGDRLILSSDGLDTLTSETIIEICEATATAKHCVEALLQAVTDAGAPRQDNTTVICIDVAEKAEAAAPGVEAVPASDFDPDATRPATRAAADSETPPVVTPAAPSAPPAPAPEPVPEKKSNAALIAAAVIVLAALAGGGYWYAGQSHPPAVERETPLVVDEGDDLVEIEAVADEPLTPASVAPAAQPEPAPVVAPVAPPAAPGKSGTFADKLKSGGEGPQMVWVPAGSYTMGSRLMTSDPDEHPQHKVRVSQFAIAVHELTIADYERFARSSGRKMPNLADASGADKANFPMYFLSWNDALAYTKWLSQQTGHNYALPSEAQWEYAARAGSDTAYWWGRKLGRGNAHCFACDTGLDPRRPTAIGRFSANKFGLYDVAGNVQEWVYDCYHQNYDAAPSDGSVFEGGDCTVRVLRGGGYASGPEALRSAARDKQRFDRGNDQTGVRVVRLP